ncbi:MAG: HAD family hydrolase [Verrucomicrobiota bacterium]
MSAKNTNCSRIGPTRADVAAVAWEQGIRTELEALIRRGAGKRLPVVFDFDNTIIRGDIGEATMAVLARSGLLTPSTLPASLCPVFRPPGKERHEIQSFADAVAYYFALLAPTAHGDDDPAPYGTGYAWAVEIMAGLRVADVVEATRSVIALSQAQNSAFIEVTPGHTSVLVPRFYPEMVELLAELIRQEFEVWIVSASNVWSVRYIVLHALNPMLRERKAEAGIRPDHVIGISTLLKDERDRLFKDALLVKEDAGYANLTSGVAEKLCLTSHLQFPLPTYSGKLACIYDAIGRRPFLGAGDGPGDRAMVNISEHQLWIEPQHGDRAQPLSARLLHAASETNLIAPVVGLSDCAGFLGPKRARA